LKTFLIANFISLASCCTFAGGCNSFNVSTNTGIFLSHHAFDAPYRVEIVPVTSADSIVLTVKIIGNCGFWFWMELENQPVPTSATYPKKFRQRPGVYKVTCQSMIYSESFTFTLVENPVGIMTFAPSSVDLKLFPNPVQEQLNLICEPDGIKNISVFNELGQLIEYIEIDALNTEINMEAYPSGIYFIQVATLSNQIVRRKITVL
jgi:hypothetical protein